MLAAYNKNTDEYHVLGFFSSKKTGYEFSKEQFKVFQSKLDDPNSTINSNKSQHFFPLDHAETISSSEVQIVKEGTKYIKASNQEGYLKSISNDLENKPYKMFSFSRITKEDCLKMCLEHDKTIKDNKKHPLTVDQIKRKLNY